VRITLHSNLLRNDHLTVPKQKQKCIQDGPYPHKSRQGVQKVFHPYRDMLPFDILFEKIIKNKDHGYNGRGNQAFDKKRRVQVSMFQSE